MELKNIRRGRIAEYVEKFPAASFTPLDPAGQLEPALGRAGRLRLPERHPERDQRRRRPPTCSQTASAWWPRGPTCRRLPRASSCFLNAEILYGPGKAANAGGVAVSGLEMTQDIEHLPWTREQVDAKLRRS